MKSTKQNTTVLEALHVPIKKFEKRNPFLSKAAPRSVIVGFSFCFCLLVAPMAWGQNTYYGTGAGVNNATGAYGNTFIGLNSGYLNTNGVDNTFLGVNSGYNNSNGNNNTFVGSMSGNLNTAYENTFVGYYSGRFNTEGHHNVFLGANSGRANTVGHSNLFVGSNAGMSNTVGGFNIFMGPSAGYTNTTGENNVFVGGLSGVSNTSGNYNSFLGHRAGYSNTTGHDNTFLGNHTGHANTTGGGNLFAGSNAGINNDGSNNAFIGTSAGFQNVSGVGNVFLGFNAGYHETGSDKLYIDNSNTTTPLVYGEFDNDLVKVNGELRWGAGSYSGVLSIAPGWNGVHPSIGSTGSGISLIMLHNPHIPFRTDNAANGYSGKAGLRMAVDANVSTSWDMGLAGDFFHIYRYGSGEFFRIDSAGHVGVGTTAPSAMLDIHNQLGQNTTPHIALNGGFSISNINNNNEVVFRNMKELRFTDTDAWDWDAWAGIAYRAAERKLVIGGSKSSYLTHNVEQEIDVIFDGVAHVGIGTTNPGNYKLAVNGHVKAKQIEVNSSGWSDFVFEDGYVLKDLEEVEAYIDKNNHLPDVPSEKEVMENGINLGKMDAILLQKIEELTLYMIELKKDNEALWAQMKALVGEKDED